MRVEVEIENELLEFFYMNLDFLISVHYGFQEKPSSYTLTQKIRKPNILKPLAESKPKSSTRKTSENTKVASKNGQYRETGKYLFFSNVREYRRGNQKWTI